VPFPDYTPSIPALLHTTAERFGPRTAMVVGSQRLSYAELEARSAALACGLLADGIGKGTHVALLMPNSIDWAVAFFAAARIGAVAVPLNTFYQVKELAWTLRHSDAAHLLSYAGFLSHDYLGRLEAALPGLAGQGAARPLYLHEAPHLRRIRVWGDCDRKWALPGGAELERLGAQAGIDAAFLREAEQGVSPADRLIIVYSSGSTADPKGAIHSQGTVVRHGFNLSHAFDVRADDRLYSPMPFFWVGGLLTSILFTMSVGACLVTQDHFDAGETLELLERERVTYVMGWAHYGKAMSDHPSFPTRDLSRIRRGNLFALLPDAIRPRDPELRANSLGMTETCGPHTAWDTLQEMPEALRGNFGRALEGVEHKIVDPDTGETLPPGQLGEVCVRGYSVMQGLYKIERERVFDADGFYHTGDSGYFNADGWLFFKGRLGEMIKTGGANVTPSEVETVLASYPEVLEAYVAGIPDAERGQLVAAAVVPRSGAKADPEALRAQLKRDLSAYKIPRHIWVCQKSELPFTDSGKIKKGELSALLARRAART
jgi:acyl-CoA synthetase (AMP-forming)/AMP-acid ligase II